MLSTLHLLEDTSCWNFLAEEASFSDLKKKTSWTPWCRVPTTSAIMINNKDSSRNYISIIMIMPVMHDCWHKALLLSWFQPVTSSGLQLLMFTAGWNKNITLFWNAFKMILDIGTKSNCIFVHLLNFQLWSLQTYLLFIVEA